MQERISRVRELMAIRQQVGKPTQEEVDWVMQEILPQVGLIEAGESYSGSEDGLSALSEYKSRREQETGVPLSRTALCANFLLIEVGMPITEVSRKTYEDGHIKIFRFFFDFATGIKSAAGRIIAAENEIAGTEDDLRARVSWEINPSVGEGADTYLHMKREDDKAAKVLIKDFTGFEIIDDLIARIKTKSFPHITPYQPTEYFLAGAEAAKTFYAKLYEMSGSLYPQKRS